MTQTQDYAAWIGHEVIDTTGSKVGKVSNVYLDDATGAFSWVAVNTGMFAKRSSFVPMDGATTSGDSLVIAWDKATVKDAPQIDDEGDGQLTRQEEEELYRYYNLQPAAGLGESTAPSQSGSDAAMTRSEEQLHVGTQTTEAGRVRLRKYVVTEQVTQTVPVSHEEVRLEREPITDENRGAALEGDEISEAEHELVLHREQPVVEKEVVPVERVRLATETVSGEETVSAEVRKEQIDQDRGDA